VKLLFVHDTKIKEDKKGNYYTDGSYSMEVWERYLSFADHFSVLARKEQIIYEVDFAQRNFNYFDKTKIKFIETPDLKASIQAFLDMRKHKMRNKIIKKAILDCDGVVVRLPSSNGNVAIKLAKKFNKPYLVEIVGCAWDALWNHSLKGKLIALPSYFAMKKSVKDAPYAVYVTSEFLQRRYPCKGKTIACPDVVLKFLDSDILHRRLNKIEQMKKHERVVLCTIGATNVRYKGQEYVIKAISKLNKEGFNFEYHLIGGGDIGYLKSVAEKNKVSNKVKFVGSIPHEKVFEYLDNIDIYVQPSITEGLPRALIEAMSRGCPAIGSNVGGIPELLLQDVITRPKDCKDIAEKLSNLANDRLLLKKQAMHNFTKSQDYISSVINGRRNEFLSDFIRYCFKR